MKLAGTRPALRCGLSVVDLKSVPGEAVFRNCHGKATSCIVIRGDYLLPICQRHPRRIAQAFPELSRN